MDDRFELVRASYGARAREYIDALGNIDHADASDLALIETWARGLNGPVLDVGCGPGQWTHFLTGLGIETEGVDPVPQFIASAKTTYPGERYRLGRAESLGVADGSLGGILAWYSLIHTEPEKIGTALTEFARTIRPGGGLALGFFTGPRLVPFAHAVTTAYSWPLDLLTTKVEDAGFVITHTESRPLSPTRTHGAILAQRA
ncbi:MAG: class I SAM-dependent methyltransferase [Propioniciclava sp.]|uniref:class I SAM-dependent methyltransferase n=1 Tax=Propioniciclava sp. TaxID=2038686 RepID=UPI0039E5BC1A